MHFLQEALVFQGKTGFLRHFDCSDDGPCVPVSEVSPAEICGECRRTAFLIVILIGSAEIPPQARIAECQRSPSISSSSALFSTDCCYRHVQPYFRDQCM